MNFLSYSVSLLGVLSNDATDEAKYKHEIFKYTPHKILQMKPIWCTIFLSMFISFLYMFRVTLFPSSGETTAEKRNKHTKKNCAPSWLYLQD